MKNKFHVLLACLVIGSVVAGVAAPVAAQEKAGADAVPVAIDGSSTVRENIAGEGILPQQKGGKKGGNKTQKVLSYARKLANMTDEDSKQYAILHPKLQNAFVNAISKYKASVDNNVDNPNGMAIYLLHKTDYGGDPPEGSTFKPEHFKLRPDEPKPPSDKRVRKVLSIARQLFTMDEDEANQWIKNHPKKKRLLKAALAAYMATPMDVYETPKSSAWYLLHKTDFGGDAPEMGDGGSNEKPPSDKKVRGFIKKVANQSTKQKALKLLEKNPKKKEKIVSLLKNVSVKQPKKVLEKRPIQVLTYYLDTTDGEIEDQESPGPFPGPDLTPGNDGAWVPSVQEMANATAKWYKNNIKGTLVWGTKKAMNFVVGTSHPINSGAYGIFGTPTNKPYKGLYKTVYTKYSFFLSIILLIILLLARVIVLPYAGLTSGGTYNSVKAISGIFAALIAVMFWWPLGTALSTFFDSLALWVAPDAKAIVTSMDSIFDLSLKSLFAAIIIYSVGLAELFGLALIYALRQGGIILFQFAMPLILVFAYAGPHPRIRSIASTIAWQYFALLVMTLPTAFIMRIAYEAQWSFGLGAVGNALLSMALLAIALAIPVVVSIATFRAPPSVQKVASGAQRTGGTAYSAGKSGLGSAKNYVIAGESSND